MLLTLDIEKPAAGGRMLARHEGQIVLVSGAIPGERVAARVERSGKGVVFADAVDVLAPSPDRRTTTGDWRCGGNVFAHIGYARQLQLKGEIIRDALGRIGRVPVASAPEVVGSPEHGYRMRARLHVRQGRIGFYLEGTHQVCDAAATGQLLPATCGWIAAAERELAPRQLAGIDAIELAENVAGDERVCHLELFSGVDQRPYAGLAEGLAGLSAQRADRPEVMQLAGAPAITDTIHVTAGDASTLLLRHDVRAFFQGNRFLLDRLVRRVIDIVPAGPVIDLYAGVGLFGLSLATAGRGPVTVVEADPVSAADLESNAAPLTARVKVVRRRVEAFVTATRDVDPLSTVIVDPPRTGLSKEAGAGLLRMNPPRIVYVSCDVATFARDTRALIDAGYNLEHIGGMDLFPNTAHVETIAAFTR